MGLRIHEGTLSPACFKESIKNALYSRRPLAASDETSQ